MVKKSSRMLQIISIFMVISAIVGILGFVSISLLAPLAAAGVQTGVSVFFTFIGLIGSLLQLVAGILGLRYWSIPAKAKICLGAGLLALLFSLANNIFSTVSAIRIAYLRIPAEIFSIILGVLIPVLFLFAAFQLYRQNAPALKAEPNPTPASEPIFIPKPEAISLPTPEVTPTSHSADTSASDTAENSPPPPA